MGDTVQQLTAEIAERSKQKREAYLIMLAESEELAPAAGCLSCSNMAHAVAAGSDREKRSIAEHSGPNLGIITAYNDMLSAHQPLADYPELIKAEAAKYNATAQVAGGVPAMCDGVTQGQPGMELSLLSRDVIALATAISLSHNVFDAVLCLGVCDKIVPGMLIGALQFGHLPAVFIPAGPMTSGISNSEKAAIRQQFAKGEIDRLQLFEAESAAYHSPGTCTFYGTANSNQLLMEFLGVQLPSTSFINAGTPLRDELTRASVSRAVSIAQSENKTPLSAVITAESLVNSMVGLLASGGSTNHTLHLIAIAAAAGLIIDWQDFARLSAMVPLLARVYPNGDADVNHFRDAGGIAYLVRELRSNGLLNEEVVNVMGVGLDSYEREPLAAKAGLSWSEPVLKSRNSDILRTVSDPFDREGGIRILSGNLGQAVIKVSAVPAEHRSLSAAVRVFSTQQELQEAFHSGSMNRDQIAVVRFQGPRANGMPELHKLTPPLAVLQERGYRVALLTDGRMSGASGKVLAAIHTSPEAACGGVLGKLRDGDRVTIDADRGILQAELSEAELAEREPAAIPASGTSLGRRLFDRLRGQLNTAPEGSSLFATGDTLQ